MSQLRCNGLEIDISLHTGRKPTSASSEAKVGIAPNSMPWQVESSEGDDARDHFKYKYYPKFVILAPP